MKKIKFSLKIVALFFSLLMFFQSCTVYKSTNVSLIDASKTDLKVKIMKLNGEKDKFSLIEVFDDGKFYGKKKIKGTSMYNYILIDEDNIEKIQIKDKVLSTILSIGIPIIIIGGGLAYALRDGIAVDLTK